MHYTPHPDCPECGLYARKAMSKDELMKEFEADIAAYVKDTGNARLRSRFFDVGNDEGRAEYAEWLAAEITAMDEYFAAKIKESL